MEAIVEPPTVPVQALVRVPAMEPLEIVCDVSHRDGVSAGAYIINDGEPQTTLLNPNHVGALSELDMVIYLVKRYGKSPLVIHTDCRQVVESVYGSRRRRKFGSRLRDLMATRDVRLVRELAGTMTHSLCHYYCRVRVGIYGTRHELYQRFIEQEKKRQRLGGELVSRPSY